MAQDYLYYIKESNDVDEVKAVAEFVGLLAKYINGSNKIPKKLKSQLIDCIYSDIIYGNDDINSTQGVISLRGPIKKSETDSSETAFMPAVYDKYNNYKKKYQADKKSTHIVYYGEDKNQNPTKLILNYSENKNANFIENAIKKFKSKYPDVDISVSNY